MSSTNNTKSLKTFFKSKILDNPFFPASEDKLIDKIVHAIENERIININGGIGTLSVDVKLLKRIVSRG